MACKPEVKDMSFENLVKRLSPTLKRITHRLNGRFTFFNDEDLYQEALIHLWLDYKEGKIEDKTDSYLLQGCYFHLKNYLRKVNEKINSVSIDTTINNEEDTDLKERLSCKDQDACFDYLDIKLFLEGIQNNGLTKREKEVLSFSLDELTVREIARRLGISHPRVVKIKKSLCHKLARTYFSP